MRFPNAIAQVAAPPSGSAQVANLLPKTPDPTGLPGTATAVSITGGVIFYSLLCVFVGLVLSAGLWAVGSFSNSYTQQVNGKKGFLICAVCALTIGASYVLLSWFYNTGQSLS